MPTHRARSAAPARRRVRPEPRSRRLGRLMVIGGSEDREHDKRVLAHLIALTGRPDPRVLVLTAASADPQSKLAIYDAAFADLGARKRVPLNLCSRDEANDPRCVQCVHDADVLFITGGDQKWLMAAIGGTAFDAAPAAAASR